MSDSTNSPEENPYEDHVGEPRKKRRPRREEKERQVKVNTAFVLTLYLLIACVIGASILLVRLSWVSGNLDKAKAEQARLEKEISEMKGSHSSLRVLYSDLQVPPQEIIRGRVVLRAENSGKRKPGAAIPLRLYKRDDLEKYLETRLGKGDADPTNPEKSSEETVAKPPAYVAMTVTNANGFYSFEVPERGRYVICASIKVKKGVKLWMLGVDTDDPLNTPIEITDLNRVLNRDNFTITEAR